MASIRVVVRENDNSSDLVEDSFVTTGVQRGRVVLSSTPAARQLIVVLARSKSGMRMLTAILDLTIKGWQSVGFGSLELVGDRKYAKLRFGGSKDPQNDGQRRTTIRFKNLGVKMMTFDGEEQLMQNFVLVGVE
jgi:hypothetical protein